MSGEKRKVNIAFLHGFGGTKEDWLPLLENLHLEFASPANFEINFQTISLPGHSDELGCATMGFQSIEDAAAFYSKKISKHFHNEEFFLCGYSMGARLALQIYQQSPTQGLILLSGGLGEEEIGARKSRYEKDLAWAALLKSSPQEFWKKWYEQPLFRSLKVPPDRTGHKNHELAHTLEVFSPGNHEFLWKNLSEVHSGLYLAGELDEKYVKISEKIARELPQIQVERIPSVGHVLPLEAPEICAKKIANWIKAR